MKLDIILSNYLLSRVGSIHITEILFIILKKNLSSLCCMSVCHPGLDPGYIHWKWIPAFAGMTVFIETIYYYNFFHSPKTNSPKDQIFSGEKLNSIHAILYNSGNGLVYPNFNAAIYCSSAFCPFSL